MWKAALKRAASSSSSSSSLHSKRRRLGRKTTTKKTKKTKKKKRKNKEAEEEDHKQWTDLYRPTKSSELCVHSRKVADVRRWLETNSVPSEFSRKFLILTGPPGCGKSVMLEVLARELGLECVHWEESSAHGQSAYAHLATSERDSRPTVGESRMAEFRSFFTRASKYKSVLAASARRKRLVILEDLPFLGKVGSQDDDGSRRREFMTIMKRLLEPSSRFLTVFVCTDHHKVFDDEFLQSPKVEQINCNAITDINVAKVLKRIADAEGMPYSDASLAELAAASNGDVRAAILSLQIGATAAVTNHDDRFNIFRTLGRVLYDKVTPDEADAVVEHSSLDPLRYVTYVHEHYLDFVRDQDGDYAAMAAMATGFSDADELGARATDLKYGNAQFRVPDEYASTVASRTYLLHKAAHRKPARGFKVRGATSERVPAIVREEKRSVLQAAPISICDIRPATVFTEWRPLAPLAHASSSRFSGKLYSLPVPVRPRGVPATRQQPQGGLGQGDDYVDVDAPESSAAQRSKELAALIDM